MPERLDQVHKSIVLLNPIRGPYLLSKIIQVRNDYKLHRITRSSALSQITGDTLSTLAQSQEPTQHARVLGLTALLESHDLREVFSVAEFEEVVEVNGVQTIIFPNMPLANRAVRQLVTLGSEAPEF